MYYKPMVKLSLPPPKKKKMISDKAIHIRFLEFINLYKQNLLEIVFIFTIYQNYTLTLMQQCCVKLFSRRNLKKFWCCCMMSSMLPLCAMW